MNQSSLNKIFLDLFPPPRFLQMPAVGLSICDRTIRFAELRRKGSFFEVGKYGEEKIPADIIEEGYIKNKDSLKNILTTIREKHGLHFVNVSLPEDKAYLFKTTVPPMEESDIDSALQFKIEENVPISLADAVFDYRIIDKMSDHIDVSVTVIHTKVVSSYLEVLTLAGFTPLRFMMESQAIASVLAKKETKGAFILAAIGETKTIIAIISRGVVEFTSTIPFSSRSVTESIKKNFSVDDAGAKLIQSGKDQKDKNEVITALANSGSILCDEIKRVIVYWESHGDSGVPIDRVVLSGSDALLGLDDYIIRSLNISTSISDPLENISELERYVPPLTKRESLDYATAIGLALPYD